MYEQLRTAAEERQTQARAPGTWANYRAAVNTYAQHCDRFGVTQMAPTPLQIRCWIEEIADRQCPSSVANNLSHIKMHFRLNNAPLDPLEDIRVKLAMDALKRSKIHKPRPTPHVPLTTIKAVLIELQGSPNHRMVAFAILIMYYTGARQSEVAPKTGNAFDKTRHTTREDVSIMDGNLRIHKKWAKNMQGNAQSRTLTLAPATNPILCPVTAYGEMIREAPTRNPLQPLLVYPKDGHTVTIPYIARTWKNAQVAVGTTTPYTLHAIRRTAATVAFASGSSELEVQRFGGWASQAHRTYINTDDSNKVNRTLISAIS